MTPHSPSSACAAIVLAAGASTRLGQPKQLLLFQGEPLVRHAACLALAAGAVPVIVIVPAGSATAVATARISPPQAYSHALADLPVILLPNPETHTGMGSSLRLGIAALAAHAPLSERVLLMVCDQPLLRLEHIQALLDAQAVAQAGIAAAVFTKEADQRPGVPAVFSRKHYPALAAATGDQGARSILRSLPVTTVLIPEAATDIDTPADLTTLDIQS